MKLPSGQEIKDETLSEIADYLAMDMLMNEDSYGDACSAVAEELKNGYEGAEETLPGLELEDRSYLLELIRIPTLQYLERLRYAHSSLYDEMLRNRQWLT